MRNPGRPSKQVSLVPPLPIDCRNRPPPPAALSDDERVLWEKLVLARRPGWYLGSEQLLQTYVVETAACQQLEQALRRTKVGAGHRYVTLAKLHRDSARLCASLAVKLKLTPTTKIDRNVSRDGDRPLAVNGLGYSVPNCAPDDDVSLCDANGERSFERLRQRMMGGRAFQQTVPPISAEDEEPPAAEPPPEKLDHG